MVDVSFTETISTTTVVVFSVVAAVVSFTLTLDTFTILRFSVVADVVSLTETSVCGAIVTLSVTVGLSLTLMVIVCERSSPHTVPHATLALVQDAVCAEALFTC